MHWKNTVQLCEKVKSNRRQKTHKTKHDSPQNDTSKQLMLLCYPIPIPSFR